ncbi:hypothetical protein BDR07DRAFT_1460170 [Suillus spraguei]|nr:hypothetical protein BDR07DRAFT_1460170 [Suillus spraguei]
MHKASKTLPKVVLPCMFCPKACDLSGTLRIEIDGSHVTSSRHQLTWMAFSSLRMTTTANDCTNDMNEPKKSDPTTQVVHEQATATNISYSQPSAQPVAEIISAAQRGDLNAIRELVESGKCKVTDRDDQNVTPLHWAAINAQLATCRYLIEQGAEIDAIGGDLQATPLQWAARNGYLYIVQLLISHNADPTIADTQGYNSLHLVTHSSSHGANPNLKDDTGLTPLHWAVVRGNRVILRRLIEMGADIHAKDLENRTPRDMAVELKSLGAWKRAMEEGGLTEHAQYQDCYIHFTLLVSIFHFTTLAILPWYTGIILAMAEFFAMHHIVTRVLLNKNTYVGTVNQSPYFAGIIAGSMLWVGYCWITRLVQQTESHAFVHLAFAIIFGLCLYNFFRAITLDPGLCPRPAHDGELKAIIEDLASEGRLNGQTFAYNACHCPWVWNCVGANNHRQFLLFVSALVIDIVLFDYLVYEYFSSMSLPESVDCFAILCEPALKDAFLLCVSLWSALQLTWTSVLLVTQYWQVTRQLTTFEVSNLGRFGFMGGRGTLAAGSGGAGVQMGHRHHHGAHQQNGDTDSEAEGGAHKQAHNHTFCGTLTAPGTCTAFLLNLLGLDRFTRGRAARGLTSHARNPFDFGAVRNCKDFWSMGKELGVEYGKCMMCPWKVSRKQRNGRKRNEPNLSTITKVPIAAGVRVCSASSACGWVWAPAGEAMNL